MYVIDGHLFFDITIGDNNTPFPIGTGNLQAMNIVEHPLYAAPVMEIIFQDIQGALNNTISLTDGVKIGIQMGRIDDQAASTYSYYRLFGRPHMAPSSGGQTYVIRGMLDSATYIRSHLQKAYKGTSSQALQQLASDAGLSFDGVPTNDSQTWLPSRCSFFEAATRIVHHGFIDDKSCMMHALTRDKVLKYYNLTSLITQNPVAALYMGDPTQLPKAVSSSTKNRQFQVWDYAMHSSSGLFNYFTGYGAKQSQQTLTGSLNINNNIQATLFSSTFDISSDVYNQTKVVRNVYAPPDAGNTHSMYFAAKYQNERNKALYSSPVDLLLENMSGLQLFDVVYVQLVDKSKPTNHDRVYRPVFRQR